ncbi:major facilitator superfamily transporter [Ceratobasidium sp. AG-Ba]|nr:major facilitator superfamily transporter [Ceratobasidium sp. AG-Ba]QRW14694.1 major facilitator superfamily transporter [Ceratobasidium sp. AG-Ba]
MGQYAFAAGWGVVVDRIGPWACSLSASVLFLFSYGTFAYLLANSESLSVSYRTLAVLFFIAGCGRVASYFSAIFSSRTRGCGLATSVPLALSGLSPLFLSYVASLGLFQLEDGKTLDTPKFIGWMGVGCGIVHIIGVVGLRHVNEAVEFQPEVDDERTALLGDEARAGEEDRLLKKQTEAIRAGCVVVHRIEPDESLVALLKDVSFWIYIAVGVVITGTAEMVIANMGSIVMEFPGGLESAATQVRLMSIAGTIARLCTGPLADWISPPIDEGSIRMVFPMAFLAMLASGYMWTALYVSSAAGLWVLSIGTGLGYGGSWAVLPSITSAIWGERNLGRNFGILSYAPLVGTPIFTYLYAWSTEDGHPKNMDWRTNFGVCAAATVVAMGGCVALWRRWDGRL